jgi:hypothetical protein
MSLLATHHFQIFTQLSGGNNEHNLFKINFKFLKLFFKSTQYKRLFSWEEKLVAPLIART